MFSKFDQKISSTFSIHIFEVKLNDWKWAERLKIGKKLLFH